MLLVVKHLFSLWEESANIYMYIFFPISGNVWLGIGLFLVHGTFGKMYMINVFSKMCLHASSNI